MKNILDYLERTTVCNAWKTAVDDGNICMTWLELQEMSKSIGTALCKRTGRQKPVVILAEKSASHVGCNVWSSVCRMFLCNGGSQTADRKIMRNISYIVT